MQPNKEATVEFLEKGQFIITRSNEQQYKGRFTMVAFDRFCMMKEVDSYFELLRKIAIGMKLGDYADLLLVAFQDYYRDDPKQCPIKREDVMDMIDELGGIGESFLSIIKHATGRLGGNKNKEEEKKNLEETEQKS